jgi:hypothetical protein|tara:strand:+ start:132 stop:551 length:420 start_codon:yes stop_codon:yes gene_type:complete
MAPKFKFNNALSLINFIFSPKGDDKVDTQAGGNERFESQKEGETTKKKRNDFFKRTLAASEAATRKQSEDPDIFKGPAINLSGNPYDLSAVKIKTPEQRNSPLFASLNDIQSGNLKMLGEKQGQIMGSLFNLPKTVVRR